MPASHFNGACFRLPLTHTPQNTALLAAEGATEPALFSALDVETDPGTLYQVRSPERGEGHMGWAEGSGEGGPAVRGFKSFQI